MIDADGPSFALRVGRWNAFCEPEYMLP